MQILPAIDIRGGKCVRLRQGDYDQETIFGDDPVEMARRWVDEGASGLHLVDLDGAREGRPVNAELVARIVETVSVPCQLGGGLRTTEGVRDAIASGVQRIIIGTQAVRDPEWFASVAEQYSGQVVLGVDAKDGNVATDGWLEGSSLTAVELIDKYRDLPLAAVVYTDIAKDGMMAGPNVEATVRLQAASPFLVVASGGISCVEDVLNLASSGINACILGRSIYEGKVKLAELRTSLSKL